MNPVEANVVFGPGVIPSYNDVVVPPTGPLVQGEELATEAFDILMAAESPIAELTTDPNNILFYVNPDNGTKSAVAYDVSGLIQQYNDHNFLYECNEKKEAASVGDPADTKGNASTPYYKIELLGRVLVPVKQLLVALKSGHRHWLLRNKTRIPFTVSYKSFVDPTRPARTAIDPDTQLPYPNTMIGDGSARLFPINYDDEPVSGEGSSICKEGFDAYSLFPVDADNVGPYTPPPGSEISVSEGSEGSGESEEGSEEENSNSGSNLGNSNGQSNFRSNVSDLEEEDIDAALALARGVLQPKGPTLLGRFGSAVSSVTGLLGKGAGFFLTPPEAGRGPRVPRAPRIPPPSATNPYLDPHVKQILDSLYHPGHRPEPEESAVPVVLSDNPLGKEGDSVSAFVVWLDKVLIYRDSSSNLLSVPTGPATVDEPFVTSVRDILRKKTALTPLPTTVKLLRHVTDTAEKTHGYYYYKTEEKPEVAGLDGVDISFNFGEKDIAGEKAGDTGYWWAPLTALRLWISQPSNEEYRSQEFVNMLRELALKVGIGIDINEDDLRELPAWSKGLYDPKKITAACRTAKVMTNDCIAKTMRKDIFIGHDESRENRLAKRTDDPALVEYIRLTKALEEETDPMKKDAIRIKLEKRYKDRTVYVRDGSDNTISPFTVPNPYRALSYREDPVTTFANPAGDGVADPDDETLYSAADDGGTMRQQNLKLLKELVPNEIIADKPMSVAILESLWYCGQNPTISNDPRCFPARLLGELREYQMNQLQKNQAIEAKAVLEHSGWPMLKIMLATLRQTIAGSKVFQYRADLFTPAQIPEDIPVPDISGIDISGIPVDLSGVVVDLSKAPGPGRGRFQPLPRMQTGVHIVPRSLGGGGFQPILPRPLGGLLVV